VPLAQTEYNRRSTRAQATSDLPELLAAGDDKRPVHLPWQVIDGGVEVVAQWLRERLDEPCRLITADAADERHLDVITQAVLPLAGRVLLVGSAGWAERLAMACKGLMGDAPVGPGALGVVGSLSALATRQVHVASQAGVTVVQLPSPAARPLLCEAAHDWQSVVQTLAAGRSAVLWTNPGDLRTASRAAGQRVLRALAEIVRELLSITPVSGLMIVGGDTAQSVLHALRVSGLELVGEVAPGVPYGRLLDGPYAGLPTATKAGGFGADTVLVDCLKFLRRGPLQ
jgi:D-threonate/D-erythronate kinase